MKKLPILAGFASLTFATPTVAHHAENLGIPFDSRGDCESTMDQFRSRDKDFLTSTFPQIFSTAGDVNSFLSRAFTCDLSDVDGQWYISDHRAEVLASDWFQRRSR